MSMDLVTAFVRDPEHALEPYPPTDDDDEVGGKTTKIRRFLGYLVRLFSPTKSMRNISVFEDIFTHLICP